MLILTVMHTDNLKDSSNIIPEKSPDITTGDIYIN